MLLPVRQECSLPNRIEPGGTPASAQILDERPQPLWGSSAPEIPYEAVHAASDRLCGRPTSRRRGPEDGTLSQVASSAMSADVSQSGVPGDPHEPGVEQPATADQIRAAAALHEAFTRLAPQGSDAWNFLAAFTHLGDRYGPYHPGASALSDAVASERADVRRTGPLDRLRPRRNAVVRAPENEKTDLEVAMGHVVEAFRFLSGARRDARGPPGRTGPTGRRCGVARASTRSSDAWPHPWRRTSWRRRRAG